MTKRRLHRRLRPGFSLLELMLFLAIFAAIAGTLVSVFVTTQDARIRQQGIAALEQRGGQVLEVLTRRIRRAETILTPVAGQSGSILALQMTQNDEHPTILAQSSGSNILVVQKDTVAPLLSDRLGLSNLRFSNINNTSVRLSFDLFITLQLPTAPVTYRRHFDTAVALFPHDFNYEGGCNPDPNVLTPACPAPTCVSHVYRWYTCTNEVCTQSNNTLSC